MQNDQFYIIFYESGVEIYKWRFNIFNDTHFNNNQDQDQDTYNNNKKDG